MMCCSRCSGKNSANTAVTIYDGSTIMLGGVMEERRVDIQDKVPVIGDIPLIGRLWQTKVSQSSKKHVIFFITVTVIDPSGHADQSSGGRSVIGPWQAQRRSSPGPVARFPVSACGDWC